MKKKVQPNNTRVAIGVCSLIVVITILSYFAFLNLRSDNVNPLEQSITGNVVYNVPLTLDQLRQGVYLDKGWNTLYWTNEINEDVPVTRAFASIINNTYYFYDYRDGKYWFNPDGVYSRYNQLLSGSLFNQTKKGRQYGIYLIRNATLYFTQENITNTTITQNVTNATNSRGDYAKGRVIIKFKAGTVFPSTGGAEGESATLQQTNQPSINQILTNHKAKTYKKISKDSSQELVTKFLGEGEGAKLFEQTYLISGVDDTQKTIDDLKKNPYVIYAEPDYFGKLTFVPNDVRYKDQWSHQLTNIEKGWDIQKGSSDIIIAFIDSGIDMNHPELKDKLIESYDFVNIDQPMINVIISSGDYLLGDYKVRDIIPDDEHGHGSHVAGIAAAKTNNNEGIAGVCNNCKIMPLRVFFNFYNGQTKDLDVTGFTSDIVDAVYYATNNNAQVISMSLDVTKNQALEEAIAYAISHGVVVVAAAGNEGKEKQVYPCAYNGVICVASVDQDKTRSSFSNYGDHVDIAAPGGKPGVLSTTPTKAISYYKYQGTSMATPYIAGVAGLILSHYKLRSSIPLTSEQVSKIISSSNIIAIEKIGGIIDVDFALRQTDQLYCKGADINKDGKVDKKDIDQFVAEFKFDCHNAAPIDVLQIINAINEKGNGQKCLVNNTYCQALDMSNDGYLTPIDAIQIINAIEYSGCNASPRIKREYAADLTGDGFPDNRDRTKLLDLIKQYPLGTTGCKVI